MKKPAEESGVGMNLKDAVSEGSHLYGSGASPFSREATVIESTFIFSRIFAGAMSPATTIAWSPGQVLARSKMSMKVLATAASSNTGMSLKRNDVASGPTSTYPFSEYPIPLEERNSQGVWVLKWGEDARAVRARSTSVAPFCRREKSARPFET